jgi:hypothetical protein
MAARAARGSKEIRDLADLLIDGTRASRFINSISLTPQENPTRVAGVQGPVKTTRQCLTDEQVGSPEKLKKVKQPQ